MRWNETYIGKRDSGCPGRRQLANRTDVLGTGFGYWWRLKPNEIATAIAPVLVVKALELLLNDAFHALGFSVKVA
jgi:hypothetical protein